MDKVCKQYWAEIVELAQTGAEPAGGHHIASCAECGKQLAQARKMMQAFSLSQHEAPASLVNMAKGIMPAKSKQTWATLIRSNVALQGVRSATTDIQALFEADDHKVHVQYHALRNGWEILGQVSPRAEAGEYQGKQFRVDDQGRFKLKSKDLQRSEFVLRTDVGDIVVPAIGEGSGDER
jgi:hypothetical protein